MEVSRKHADLEYTGKKWRIRDLSRNGVYVNEVLIVKGIFVRLKKDDVIRFTSLDKIRYKFVCGEPDEPVPEENPVPVPIGNPVPIVNPAPIGNPVPIAVEGQSGLIPDKRLLEIMQEELSCAVCHEILIEPTTIGCGHTFCTYCVGELIHRRQRSCPVCRARFSKRMKPLQLRNLTAKLFELLPVEDRLERQQVLKDRKLNIRVRPQPHVRNTMFIADFRDFDDFDVVNINPAPNIENEVMDVE
jgi:pSer/pThr/pTyr-binding forkhead associated (FHA) protein